MRKYPNMLTCSCNKTRRKHEAWWDRHMDAIEPNWINWRIIKTLTESVLKRVDLLKSCSCWIGGIIVVYLIVPLLSCWKLWDCRILWQIQLFKLLRFIVIFFYSQEHDLSTTKNHKYDLWIWSSVIWVRNMGGTETRWLALLPHSKRVLGSIPFLRVGKGLSVSTFTCTVKLSYS